MNPRNWNRRFRRGKSLSCLPVRERWRMPPGHLPSSGPPAPLYPGAGRMPGASDPGRALRSPSGTPFPPPSRSAGSHMQDGAVSPPGRIAGAISCRALPFLAPCRFSLAGGADCHGEGFREKRAGHPPQAPPPLRHSVPSGIHPDAGRRSAAPELPVPSGRQQGKTAHPMIPPQPPASGMNVTRLEGVSLPCGSGSHARPLQR